MILYVFVLVSAALQAKSLGAARSQTGFLGFPGGRALRKGYLPLRERAERSHFNSETVLAATTNEEVQELLAGQGGYSGPSIDRFYWKRPLEVSFRLLEIGFPLLSWYLATRLDERTETFRSLAKTEELRRQRAIQLRETLVATKSVTFVKSGQALALRPDLVKFPEYIEELSKLQDAVGTFENEEALDIIREDLGVEPSLLFDFASPDPLASASIGQVYKATLRPLNKTVALKVQRPRALASAAVDMFILRRFAEWWKAYKKLRTDMLSLVDEFGKQLFSELDYRQEARNCKRFFELYGGGNVPGVAVPDVYENYTSRRVLTQEWIEGEKGPWEVDGQRMLMMGLQCTVLQLFDSGFFHADPHRGNLLRTQDAELCYLDFGMMANVTAEQRYGLIGTLLGLQNGDIGLIAENLVRLGFLPDETRLDLVVPALQDAIRDATGGEGTSKLNFTKLNENVQEISYLLPFRIPPFYATIIRTITILEGLALNVDPDFKLVKGSYPYVARQILDSNAEELRKLLKQVLITPEGRIRWKRLEQLLQIASAAGPARTSPRRAAGASASSSSSRSSSSSTVFADSALAANVSPDSSTDEYEAAYQRYKAAQDKSDLRRFFDQARGDEEEIELSAEFIFQVLDFLFSERGDFLLDALANELVDLADDVSLAALGFASIVSGGLIPRSRETPDRERLELVLRLALTLVDQRRQRQQDGERHGHQGAGKEEERVEAGTQRELRRFLEVTARTLRDPEQQRRYAPIVRKAGGIASDVLRRIAARNVQRAARAGISRILSPGSMASAGTAVSVLASLAGGAAGGGSGGAGGRRSAGSSNPSRAGPPPGSVEGSGRGAASAPSPSPRVQQEAPR